jgi:hypothetical protein
MCICCRKLSAKAGKVRCVECVKAITKQGIVNGWINLFNLYLNMRGKCAVCGNTDLRVLIIKHIEYYNHHIGDNGRMSNKRKLKARQRANTRAEILQGYRAGNYLLLCCNCNKLEAQKQVRSEPYIQQALIELDRLNINNNIECTSENNQNVLQVIQLNIVICMLYLFILFCLYHCGTSSVL